ncbi:MAG: cytochrome c biogenesis protein CcdA [Archaeoglobus sp.]|uniref:cytochrome c biogenesis CcdA family protein n=1 Tax=Archaeoglobus sp. TaxID=1872626 RepID=UPI001D68F1BD|nr:cytochrome c biogenesis CcdA family protein [Archaeoglobus sp.]MBO8180621.1 cytochrome c biogenesis protein CcdA [Archaeoglobus sp.]
MLELLMAFALGILSIFSPCVLPVIPLIFAGSRGRALDAFLIVAGLTFSMLITGYTASLFFGVFRTVAMLFLLLFAIILLSDELEEKISILASRMTSKLSWKAQTLPSFFFGMFLAFLWLPCILPFAGIAISQTLLSENPLVMLSYGLGMALTIAFVFKAGEKFVKANFNNIKRIAGIIVLVYLFYFALTGVVF